MWLIGIDEKIIRGYNGLRFFTDYTIDSCPHLDVLVVPGGLLKYKHATTYHTAFDELSEMGVIVEKSKVVQDGNIITGAGVSSGIDVGLYLLSKLFDEATAQQAADKIEYIWHKD